MLKDNSLNQKKSYKILVVEDDGEARNTYCKILDRLDYEYIDTSNGKDALELIKGPHNFDLAVIDLFLPDIRGDRLLKHIRETEPEMKGIILSGYKVDDANKSLDIPVSGYLHKPFNIDDFSEMIKKTLKKWTSLFEE